MLLVIMLLQNLIRSSFICSSVTFAAGTCYSVAKVALLVHGSLSASDWKYISVIERLSAAAAAAGAYALRQEEGDLGRDILMAGLVFHVFALALFATAATGSGLRSRRAQGRWDERHHTHCQHPPLRVSPRRAAPLSHHDSTRPRKVAGLAVSTLTIFTRGVYRITELPFGSDVLPNAQDGGARKLMRGGTSEEEA
ncbi:RTA1 domain protein [Marssonina coronariae]|uniref:RTA1 domain protein n=1 Tax=Diplocarpon coronariae TaxID=2795749 RepID=A0A218Z8S5_9HELO|nr:RTA1 domain protein [Marssonina coronariae]